MHRHPHLLLNVPPEQRFLTSLQKRENNDMTRLFGLLAACVVLLCASLALAGPPIEGDYDSSDIGGPIDVGRYTEGWDAGGVATGAGTTFNAASWDGAVLGATWAYTCGTLAGDGIILTDNVDANGNGSRTWMKTFTGGTLWLSGAGPWGNGDAEYTGPILSYVEFETLQYSNFVRVAAVTNVQARAAFDAYPGSCIAFSVANGTEVGATDLGMMKPADYPDFLMDGSCMAGAPEGAWWNMSSITLSINYCAVPVNDESWGTIKAKFNH